MIRGFYSAKTGLVAHQESLNTIASNISNVNTAGFKPMRTAFKDLVYQNLNREEVENEVLVGHGVKINKNDIQFAQAAPTQTDYPLDFCLTEANSFFAVNGTDGQTYYTRAGNFQLSNSDDTYYLVTGSGDRVLDADGEEIEVEFDENQNPIIDASMIGVYSFPNYYALEMAGDNRLRANEFSGEAEAIENPEILEGYLEGSGTELAREMANMIVSQRAFQLSARVVTTADEIAQEINSLRQ
jgi:flagellar basal-body rod protein FlgG